MEWSGGATAPLIILLKPLIVYYKCYYNDTNPPFHSTPHVEWSGGVAIPLILSYPNHWCSNTQLIKVIDDLL